MKSLRDASSIARAPALSSSDFGTAKLDAEKLECLIGHPMLKRLNFGVGRLKDNEKIAAMFSEEMTQPVNYSHPVPICGGPRRRECVL